MTEAKPSILLVDDTEANLFTLEAVLGDMPCQLVHAGSGNEALRQLLKREFALILLDVQMPNMDGYEVARHVRQNPATRDVPIIFLTALQGSEDNALRAYGSGAVDFLPKPINPTVLRSKVRVFLDLYAARQRLATTLADLRRAEASEARAARDLAETRAALIGELERKNKELEAFSYSVSHDLRAPLRSITGFSQALLEDYGEKLDGAGQEHLQRVVAAARRMDQLIDDLLNLSRVDRTHLVRGRVDLSVIARKVVAALEAATPDRRIDVVIQEGLVVEADLGLITVVIENLIGNAFKFTGRTASPRIEFGRLDPAPGGDDVFYVRDNGAGFDGRQAATLFRPFQRLHRTSEFPGTGIGLATVQRIIERHGGRVWAEGELGSGATVRFTIAAVREPSV